MLVIGFIAVQCRMIEMGLEEMLTVDFMGMNEEGDISVITYENYQQKITR